MLSAKAVAAEIGAGRVGARVEAPDCREQAGYVGMVITFLVLVPLSKICAHLRE